MKKLLLTGFGPYGHTPVNPSEKVANKLNQRQINNLTILSTVVPNTFFESITFVKEIMLKEKVDYVLMMGEYTGRSLITFERFGHNFIDSSRYQLQDNQGVSYDHQKIVANGPIAYQSDLPLKAMVESTRKAGVPADISDTPGTFVCNHLLYGILHEIKAGELPIKAGWAHLPMLPSTATQLENLGMPSMSAETSSLGIEAAIAAITQYPHDIDQSLSAGFQI